MALLGICLQDFISSYPTGASLEDDNGKLISSEYCSDVAEYVEFAREHADMIDEDTVIGISVRLGDVNSTAVLEFAREIITAIQKEIADE